jgi:hypothetical protein
LDVEREMEGEEVERNNNNNNDYYSRKRSSNRKKITMTQFVQRYNSPIDTLSRHFPRPIFANFYNKIFGEIQYVGRYQ